MHKSGLIRHTWLDVKTIIDNRPIIIKDFLSTDWLLDNLIPKDKAIIWNKELIIRLIDEETGREFLKSFKTKEDMENWLKMVDIDKWDRAAENFGYWITLIEKTW